MKGEGVGAVRASGILHLRDIVHSQGGEEQQVPRPHPHREAAGCQSEDHQTQPRHAPGLQPLEEGRPQVVPAGGHLDLLTDYF